MTYEKNANVIIELFQKEKVLFKLSGGIYYCPKDFLIGPILPGDYELIEAFLKDDRFLIITPNTYP